MNFGGVIEEVMTREEFPLEKAREVLKNETIAVLGYGVQGPGQACNLRDNGFNVIVWQDPLFQSWLCHYVERPHGCGSAEGYRRHHGGTEGQWYQPAHYVP